MHISDINECLSELPEISVLESFRRRPMQAPLRQHGQDAADAHVDTATDAVALKLAV